MGKYGVIGIAKHLLGDRDGARVALLKAKEYAEKYLAAAPDEAKRHGRVAEALAWLGEKEAAIAEARDRGVTHMAFGDLFLEDIRAYRVRLLEDTGIGPLFPVWSSVEQTPALARRMLEGGIKAVVTCVDPSQLASFASGELLMPPDVQHRLAAVVIEWGPELARLARQLELQIAATRRYHEGEVVGHATNPRGTW